MERLTARSPKNNMACLVKVKPNEQYLEGAYDTLLCVRDCIEQLAKYEDTGLTPKQIEDMKKCLKRYDDDRIAAQQECGSVCEDAIEMHQQIKALTADKDEQAGTIMRMENMLYQAKDVLQMGVDYLNHDKPFDPLGSMKIAIKAIDALLGGKEDA